MSLRINKAGEIYDERCPNDKIFIKELSVCYTLLTDNIKEGKVTASTPYTDREDLFCKEGDFYYAKDTDSRVALTEAFGGIKIDVESKRECFSEYGINLPFNFMGRKNGGGWKNQLLFNSPYVSEDKRYIYAYLTKSNGCNLAVAILSDADGWKMDYSPYSFGHFFVNLKLLANFDKAYRTLPKRKQLSIILLPVSDFHDCLDKLSKIYDAPFLDYSCGGGKIGERLSLYSFGDCDGIVELYKDESRILPFESEYTLKNEGETTLIPVKNGKMGAGVSVFAYDDIISLYKKSMDTVDTDLLNKYTDGNLCEAQCWASAMLRYLLNYKNTLGSEEIASYEGKLKELLDIITEEDEIRAVPRRTIFKHPHKSFGPYNIFDSYRIQEQFFGVTILLDAYKYFGDEKYYEYAIGATDCLIRDYIKEDGRIEVSWGIGARDDYTTVCCPMIPICDMALFLHGKDEKRAETYLKIASNMAEYLYKRGLNFPTEGCKNPYTEEEMEDGSISCTALALLYYCKNIEYREEYVKKAKEILDIHDIWIIRTPICQMHGSTLRWWETQWEGDADGPAICAGHAWTIWRAEADYLYYELTGDKDHLERAKNGFMTNLSKIDEKGNSYAIYNPDMINGGGFDGVPEEIRYRVSPKFPIRPDFGISRYLWIRMNDTFLK